MGNRPAETGDRLGEKDVGHRPDLGGGGPGGLKGASQWLGAMTESLGSVAPTRISGTLCLRTASPSPDLSHRHPCLVRCFSLDSHSMAGRMGDRTGEGMLGRGWHFHPGPEQSFRNEETQILLPGPLNSALKYFYVFLGSQ